MRCAWCGAPAVWYISDAVTVPTCKAHVRHSEALDDARVAMARPWWLRWRDDATLDSRVEYRAVEVARRDARELRGEAIDWTRPVEGWALFDAGPT